MPVVADRLQRYAEAVADPTRGLILIELDRAGELTATQVARKVGITANNAYHHMRVLLDLGVVDPPRTVPGPTYVEKYYRINPETQAALRLDPAWYQEAQGSISAEDRKAVTVSMCWTFAHLLRHAAQTYQAMDAETVDRYVYEDRVIMLLVNRVSRDELRFRMQGFFDVLEQADQTFAEDLTPRTDMMIVAGLPDIVRDVE